MRREAKILLVEDNKMDIELTLDAFRKYRIGNDVQVVRTGEEALDYMLGHGEYGDRGKHPIPDLVLLDLKLPGLDGIDVLKEIKQRPGIRRIPIIVLTSSNDEGDRVMSYDHGANSYLVKPVDFEGFLEVVKSIETYWLTLNVSAPADWEEEKP